jgi:hypothetical protein
MREDGNHQSPVASNERILKDIAKTRGMQLAPFPHGVMSAENWVDSCHLNSQGCSQKALHIASFVQSVLWADELRKIPAEY